MSYTYIIQCYNTILIVSKVKIHRSAQTFTSLDTVNRSLSTEPESKVKSTRVAIGQRVLGDTNHKEYCDKLGAFCFGPYCL